MSSVSDIKMDITKIAYDVGDGTTPISKATAQTDYTDAAPETMGIVSSVDGLKFYAPTALKSTNDYGEDELEEVTTKKAWTNDNEYVGYLKYGLKVYAPKDSGSAKEMKYKFNIAGVGGSLDSGITASYRIAFYETNSSWASPTKIGIYSATARTAGGTDNKGWYDNSGTLAQKQYATEVLPTTETAFATAVTTASPIEKYYVVSIWLEGADAAAVNALGGKQFKASIEFSLNTIS